MKTVFIVVMGFENDIHIMVNFSLWKTNNKSKEEDLTGDNLKLT